MGPSALRRAENMSVKLVLKDHGRIDEEGDDRLKDVKEDNRKCVIFGQRDASTTAGASPWSVGNTKEHQK